MNSDLLIDEIQNKLRAINSEKLLFHAKFPIEKHLSKKNSRKTKAGRRSKKTGQRTLYPGKSDELKYMETYICLNLAQAMAEQEINEPIEGPIHAVMHYHYGGSYSKFASIADLSNRHEIYQDCMESGKGAKAGLIVNDTQIKSHDGSRIYKNDDTFFECFLLRFEEETDLRTK